MELPVRANADGTVSARSLPRGRAGAAGAPARGPHRPGGRLTHASSAPRHRRRGRAAGRTAERGGGGRHRGQDRVRRPAERRGPAGHRGVGVREPEVGAADGRRCRRLRRHHATARRAATLRSSRIWPGSSVRRSRCAGDRDLRCRLRDVQPTQHQPEHRRRLSPSTGRSARGPRRQGMRVRAYLSTAFGCPYEGDVPVVPGRRACRGR